jgi:hypothetical protein
MSVLKAGLCGGETTMSGAVAAARWQRYRRVCLLERLRSRGVWSCASENYGDAGRSLEL